LLPSNQDENHNELGMKDASQYLRLLVGEPKFCRDIK
jgi:hypothetical protein